MQTSPNKPYYLLFDLKAGKYLTKDGKAPVCLEQLAGVFGDNEVDLVLKAKYGSTDRASLATRVTIVLRS